MKTQLIISPETMVSIRNHAREAYPEECCGFMFGIDGEVRNVLINQEIPNETEGERTKSFKASPVDYLRAERFAIQNELDFLGIYHSHPNGPAIPSEKDKDNALPVFSYVIVSVIGGVPEGIRSWQLNEGLEFEEEAILRFDQIAAINN